MEVYLLKSTACLALFFTFYKLMLEKESIHKLKRCYLLASLLLSFVIPLTTFTTYEAIKPIEVVSTSEIIPAIENITESKTISIESVLLITYSFISIIFLFFFTKNLLAMVKRIITNEKNEANATTRVLLKELIVPHTFLKYIFINKEEYKNNSIPKSVLVHEEAHAKQKHSLDILLIELLQIVFWFNPLIYLYKKAIKLNHEFLADEAVLKLGFETKNYQETLLAYSSHATTQHSGNFGLANAINYSLIKKRLTIMRTKTTKKAIWLRSMLLLPLLAMLLFSFSTREVIYQEKATKQMVAEYNKLAKKYNQEKIDQYHYKEVKRLTYIYKVMTTVQKENAEPFPNFPPPPPPPPAYPENAEFFINFKKVSLKDVKSLDQKKIQTVDIMKLDKNGNKAENPIVYITTKGFQKKEYSTIPAKINGKVCNSCFLEMTKEQLKRVVLSAQEKGKNIASFKVKIPKNPTITCKGGKLNNDTKNLIDNAKKGQMIQFFDIKVKDLKSKPPIVITLID